MAIDRIVVVAAAAGEVRAAFLKDGLLCRLEVSRPDDRARAGDIYLGRVTKVAPQLGAAFVAIGLERDGLLAIPEKGGRGAIGEGDAVLVQVRRQPEAGKGARLTARPSLPGRVLVLVAGGTEVRVSRRIGDDDERRRLGDLAQALPAAANTGWIVRSAAAGATAESLSNEAERLSARWAEIEARRAASRPPALLHRAPDAALAAIVDEAGPELAGIIVDDPGILAAIRAALPEFAGRIEWHAGPEAPFEAYGVEEQIEAALAPRVPLPSGGVVAIAETAAVVAVDVDSGSAGGERRRGDGGPGQHRGGGSRRQAGAAARSRRPYRHRFRADAPARQRNPGAGGVAPRLRRRRPPAAHRRVHPPRPGRDDPAAARPVARPAVDRGLSRLRRRRPGRIAGDGGVRGAAGGAGRDPGGARSRRGDHRCAGGDRGPARAGGRPGWRRWRRGWAGR